jgi:hypothetical protein
MAVWFRAEMPSSAADLGASGRRSAGEPVVLGPLSPQGPWAYLRAARFTGRPGHADQLHLDLWWRGHNIALDPGSYLYNAPPPWQNSLARSGVHNTLTINGREQMTWAGRFLWVDRAQAHVVEKASAPDGSWVRCTAEHDGYRRLGLAHRRSVTLFQEGRVQVVDGVEPLASSASLRRGRASQSEVELHWLLPDWEWEAGKRVSTFGIRMKSPFGVILIEISLSPNESRITNSESRIATCLYRAGALVWGQGPDAPTRGWISPTYGQLIPALSLVTFTRGFSPIFLTTSFNFPS